MQYLVENAGDANIIHVPAPNLVAGTTALRNYPPNLFSTFRQGAEA